MYWVLWIVRSEHWKVGIVLVQPTLRLAGQKMSPQGKLEIPRHVIKNTCEVNKYECGLKAPYFVTNKTIIIEDSRRPSNSVIKGDVVLREKCGHQST
jgi:hypothetical protein